MKWMDDPIGKDCINLNTTLARWLALRLQFLGDNTNGWPITDYFGEDDEASQEEYDRQYRNWRIELWDTAKALKDYADMKEGEGTVDEFDESGKAEKIISDAKKAIQWVAKNFVNLWD